MVRPSFIETTFQESRAHLGVETQRQWSDLAIARTTPALFGLFSLVTLWAADPKIIGSLSTRSAAWYQKREPSFSDAIAAVRRLFWSAPILSMSRLWKFQLPSGKDSQKRSATPHKNPQSRA